jgi:hypothetical protein
MELSKLLSFYLDNHVNNFFHYLHLQKTLHRRRSKPPLLYFWHIIFNCYVFDNRLKSIIKVSKLKSDKLKLGTELKLIEKNSYRILYHRFTSYLYFYFNN